jgi:hypothetical protein
MARADRVVAASVARRAIVHRRNDRVACAYGRGCCQLAPVRDAKVGRVGWGSQASPPDAPSRALRGQDRRTRCLARLVASSDGARVLLRRAMDSLDCTSHRHREYPEPAIERNVERSWRASRRGGAARSAAECGLASAVRGDRRCQRIKPTLRPSTSRLVSDGPQPRFRSEREHLTGCRRSPGVRLRQSIARMSDQTSTRGPRCNRRCHRNVTPRGGTNLQRKLPLTSLDGERRAPAVPRVLTE